MKTKQQLPVKDQVKFVLRLSPKLHQRIKREAKAKNTSMNRHISDLLESKGVDDKKLQRVLKLLEK